MKELAFVEHRRITRVPFTPKVILDTDWILQIHILLTICLNDGKKLSITSTLKKIIVGGAENGAVFLILVHRVRIIILFESEVFFLLILVCETNLISRQYLGVVLSFSTAILKIRWWSAVRLILKPPTKVLGLFIVYAPFVVRIWPSRVLSLLMFIWSILLRARSSLLVAHLPAPFSSLAKILHFFIETF